MDITNINSKFPKLNVGDTINIDDPNIGNHDNCKVLATWYPKKGDKWTEWKEMELLGYGGSKPDEQFPQILIDVDGRQAVMYGSDDVYIQVIHRKTQS